MDDVGGPLGAEGPAEPVSLRSATSPKQLRLLLRLSETLAVTHTVDEVASAVIDIAQHNLGAMFGGVAIAEDDGRALRFVTLEPLPASLHDSRAVVASTSPRPAAVAARERRGLFFESLSAAERRMDADSAAAARESGGRSFAYLPMLLGNTMVGTLVLVWPDETTFHSEDQQLLWALARYSAQAIERAQLLAERREVARTLQAALLPVLPDISWLSMCGRYRPALLTETVGGDWYDAFVSDPGGPGGPGEAGRPATLTVSVGDVAGHDTHAAAEMGRLVAKLRALAIDRPDQPDRLLQRLERVMIANVHNRHASALVANLTPHADATATMTWANAGHPPALLLRPGDEPVYLDEAVDPLLGVLEGALERTSYTVELTPGTTLLFYTDGLVERRQEHLGDGLRRLADLADRHRQLALPDLVDVLISHTDHHDDDTVLLALRLTPER